MISKNRKQYLQSLGYRVENEGAEFGMYVPDSDYEGHESAPTENKAWHCADRHAKKKVNVLAVILDEEGQFFGVSACSAPACVHYDPGLIAMRVADDIDMETGANGMSYQILKSFNFPGASIIRSDLYMARGKKVTITGYNMETVTFDVTGA